LEHSIASLSLNGGVSRRILLPQLRGHDVMLDMPERLTTILHETL
jgi:hypothetical protein